MFKGSGKIDRLNLVQFGWYSVGHVQQMSSRALHAGLFRHERSALLASRHLWPLCNLANLLLIATLMGLRSRSRFKAPDAPEVTGYLARGGTAIATMSPDKFWRAARNPRSLWELFHSRL